MANLKEYLIISTLIGTVFDLYVYMSVHVYTTTRDHYIVHLCTKGLYSILGTQHINHYQAVAVADQCLLIYLIKELFTILFVHLYTNYSTCTIGDRCLAALYDNDG